MDLSHIPFDVPVILHSVSKHKNLQNPVRTKVACCLEDNRDVYEQLVLRRVDDNTVAIQSVRNNRYLQVRVNGVCMFDSAYINEQSLFTIETDFTCSLYFMSCFTGNFLQCINSDELVVKCWDNLSGLEPEPWHVVEPRTSVNTVVQYAPSQRYALAGRDRQRLILELAKGGNSPDEIEQIVTRLFDSPTLGVPGSAYATPMNKK